MKGEKLDDKITMSSIEYELQGLHEDLWAERYRYKSLDYPTKDDYRKLSLLELKYKKLAEKYRNDGENRNNRAD